MTNVNVGPGMTQASADARYPQKDFIQTASPASGATVAMADNNVSGTLYLTPGAGLLALTVQFPSDANSELGQIRRIHSTRAVTTLTGTGSASFVGALLANDTMTYQKVATNTWVLI